MRIAVAPYELLPEGLYLENLSIGQKDETWRTTLVLRESRALGLCPYSELARGLTRCLYSPSCRQGVFSETQRGCEHKKRGPGFYAPP